jgi:hypothetical protein
MRKKLRLMAGILGVSALLMGAPSWAQQEVPPPVPGQQAPPADPGQQVVPAPPAAPAIPAAPKAAKVYPVETLTGKVVTVNRRTPKKAGKPQRVSMVLQTDQGAVKVFLGPADYFDQQAVKLAPGDQVEVKGVKVGRLKAPMFIAGEVRKGDQVLKLRDDATGRPLWFKSKKGNGGT